MVLDFFVAIVSGHNTITKSYLYTSYAIHKLTP